MYAVLQLAPSAFQQCHCLVAMCGSWMSAGVPALEDAHLAPGPSVLLAAALRQASGRQSGAHPPWSLLETHRTASVLQLTEPVITARVLLHCSRHAVTSSLIGFEDGAMLNHARPAHHTGGSPTEGRRGSGALEFATDVGRFEMLDRAAAQAGF